MRKIIHIDMDAFFASVEQRDRPELRGKPVIVGGSAEHRGVVSTCSYEARKFGVHSAMPTKTAMRLCPNGIFLPGDFRRYRRVSQQIHRIFHEITDLVEPVSIDEAYLDVTQNKLNEPSAVKVARYIQEEIFRRTELTASAGVSYNKFLAKIASDYRKPAGLTLITPETAEELLRDLPIAKFHGIGQVTAKKLEAINIRTGADLKKLDLSVLLSMFGKVGHYYYQIVRGIDERPVETDCAPKSVGRETTFPEDCTNLRHIRIVLRTLARNVAHTLQRKGVQGYTVTLKLRYEDFSTITRSVTLERPVRSGERIGKEAVGLLEKTEAGKRPVRLAGVTVSNFTGKTTKNSSEQLHLPFPDD